jgi:dephospho-CoA kinase
LERAVKGIFKLGVTGGIGSGKSTVCRIFSVLGIPVFSADKVAREIQDRDPQIIEQINSVTGRDLYALGSLDRMTLASIIFNNHDLLEKINAIIHPAVFRAFNKWSDEQTGPYVIMDAAILFESGAADLMDFILTIVAPEAERIDRVVVRNKMTREQVLERIKNQMDDASRMSRSHYVIHNSENDMIIPAVLSVHRDLLNKSDNLN